MALDCICQPLGSDSSGLTFPVVLRDNYKTVTLLELSRGNPQVTMLGPYPYPQSPLHSLKGKGFLSMGVWVREGYLLTMVSSLYHKF